MPVLIDKKHHEAQIDALVTSFSLLCARTELLADSCSVDQAGAQEFYALLSDKLRNHPYEHVRLVLGAIFDPSSARTMGSASGKGPMDPDYHRASMAAYEAKKAAQAQPEPEPEPDTEVE